jgi:hypothetical protein
MNAKKLSIIFILMALSCLGLSIYMVVMALAKWGWFLLMSVAFSILSCATEGPS